MKVVMLAMLVGTWVAPSSAVTCFDCASSSSGTWSGSCYSPDVQKPLSTYCGDTCSTCSTFDCCDTRCYLDENTAKIPSNVKKPSDCPHGCCGSTYCGDKNLCDLASTVATFLIVVIVISIVCVICVPIAICFCCGACCFAGARASHTATTVVQQPYANMQGPPGAYPPPGQASPMAGGYPKA
eukprot:Hpha_TRINITY_DN15601_c3_g3::TRINITY_DN15601_c3_g3_i2::g.101129::m.101129